MPAISSNNRPTSQTNPPVNTRISQMPMGTARDPYIEALDAHMHAQFASAVGAFEDDGHCQIRVIGLHAYEGESWAPGLLMNCRLPSGPVPDDGPHYYRQWAFRMDLPDVTSIGLFPSDMAMLVPRLPKIRQTLIALHQTLGYIDNLYNEEAFESQIREDYPTLTDDSGLQFLLCPVNDATEDHTRMIPTDPVTDGGMENWMLDWCVFAQHMKTQGEPVLTREFLASIQLADTDDNWFSAYGKEMRFIRPHLETLPGGPVLVMEMQTNHYLPIFDMGSRFQERGGMWHRVGRKFADAGTLGMEPGLFMAGVNMGCNPLLVSARRDAEMVAAATGIGGDVFVD